MMNLSRVDALIGIAIVACYLFRNSVLIMLLPLSSILMMGGYAMLLLGAFRSISTLRAINIPTLIAGISILPGSLFCEDAALAVARFAGIILLIAVLGPLMSGPVATRIRNHSWKCLRYALPFIGVVSFFWWALRLPSLGVGDYTGIMVFANTLGPLTGLAALLCIPRGVANRGGKVSFYWYVAAALCAGVCVISASRMSMVAMAGGGSVMLFVWSMRTGRSLLGPVLVAAVLFGVGFLGYSQMGRFEQLRAVLSEKNQHDTREDLWKARLADFKAKPLFGVGVGFALSQDAEAGVRLDDNGNVNVEPGSSYLAVLAMAGACGAAGIAILVGSVLYSAHLAWRRIPLIRLMELSGAGGFMALNAVAEGWILAVGSPLCLVFWLWMGHGNDVFNHYTGEKVERRRRRHSRTRGKPGLSTRMVACDVIKPTCSDTV